MNTAEPIYRHSALPLQAELMSFGAALAFTAALFAGIAYLENVGPMARAITEITDVKLTLVPVEAPPPKPTEYTEAVEADAVPLAGLDAGPSDSPIKIEVLAPELAAFLPVTEIPPAATIRTGKPAVDFKPRAEIESDFQRIYQRSEVDRPPKVMSREYPAVPERVRNDATVMRVTLLIVIDARGAVSSVRVFRSSGNEEFDHIIANSVTTTWVFTPAIKNGRNVRCVVEQLVTVKWSGGSPFEL